MPLQDTPLQQAQPKGIEDSPVKRGHVSYTNQTLEDFKAVQSAFIDSYTNGTDLVENYKKYKFSADKNNVLQALSANKAEADVQAVEEAFIANPEGTTGSIQDTAMSVSEASSGIVANAQDADRQFVETIAANPADEETVKQVTANVKLWKDLQSMQAEISGWDTAAEIGLNLIPFYDSFRSADFAGTYFGQEEEVAAFVRGFKMLSDEEKLKRWPAVKKHIIDELGEVRGINMLSKLLDPMGSEELGEFSEWWKVFDVLDVAGIGALGMAVKSFRAGRTVPKTIMEADNRALASEATAAGVRSEEARAAMNMDETTSFGDTAAFDVTDVDGAHTKGLSTGALNNLKQFFGRADRTAEDIMAGKGFLTEGILNTLERAKKQEEAYKKLENAGHEDIKIVSSDDNSATFTYNVRDEDGNIVEEATVFDFELSDVGTWKQRSVGLLSEFIASPTTFAKNITRLDVDTAQRIDYLSARVNKQLHELERQAIKPIGNLFNPVGGARESLAKVDDVLRQGDEYLNDDGTRGKVFTTDELVGIYHLKEPEIETYYRINRLYNNLFRLRNKTKRDELASLGYHHIKLVANEEATFGRTYKTPEGAADALRQNDINLVYDAETDEVIHIKSAKGKTGSSYLEEEYELGNVVVKLDEPYHTGNERVLYVKVSKDSVEDLPAIVLHRKAGYVPRTYDDAAYFVKEVTDSVVDGNKTYKDRRTLRFFDNKKDADTYKEKLIVAAMDPDGLNLTRSQAEAKYVRLSDREEETISTALGNAGAGTGGLYTGARAQDEILYGLEGTRAKRINSFEALTRNIGNISRFVSINQWRLGLEQRWLNSINDYLKDIGSSTRVEHFGSLPDSVKGTDQGAFFALMEKQIRDWQSFPTREEQLFSAAAQRLVDWSKDLGLNRTAKMFGHLRGRDPIATARAVAFHALLGWFNPAQLWVQAQGMTNAMSLGFGKYMTKTLRNTYAFTMMGDGPVDAKTVGTIAKVVGADDVDELVALHELWRKTGYADSVYQTADYAAAAKGHGIALDAVRVAADKGLVFYRGGEMLNRRMAFLTAVERYKEAKNVDSVAGLDNVGLREIMTDANNIMINMTKANAAAFQKGVFSLPTQFLQVSTKYIETIFGANSNFTRAERGRIFAGQLALYGTAGVPTLGFVTQGLMSLMGWTQEDVENNPAIVKAWNDGFWGWVTFEIFGADLEVASRGSLTRGMSEFVDRWMFQEASTAERMLGAFGTTQQRFWDEFVRQIKPFTLGAYTPDIIDYATLPTLPVLDAISTWRNGEKAIFMHNLDVVYDSHGNKVVEREFSLMEEIGVGIGFRLSDEELPWDIKRRMEQEDSVKKKASDLILQLMNDYALAAELGLVDAEYTQRYEQQIAAIKAGAAQTPADVIDIHESIRRRLLAGDKKGQAVNRYINTGMINPAVTELLTVREALIGNKVIRLGIDTDQEEEE